jgi:hypothetical protein
LFLCSKARGLAEIHREGFWSVEKKFLSIGTKSVLYQREDMFYLVTATIVMHNMMVEERVRNDEVDNKNFYDIGDGPFKQSSSDEDSVSSQSSIENSESMAVGNFDLSNVCDSTLKYSIIQ